MKIPLIACFVVLAAFSIGVPLLAPVAPLSFADREAVTVSPAPLAADDTWAAQSNALDGQWHRVGHGETLRSIADRYYGSSRQWRTLQIANNAPLRPAVDSQLWIPGLRDEMDGLDEVALSTPLPSASASDR